MSAEALSAARRIVVKTGSSLVSDGSAPRTGWLAALAGDIAGLRASGKEVILVSSGAVALGRGALGGGKPKRLEDKQAAAAFGQPLLIRALETAFSAHEIRVAQSLLTLEDTEQRRRWLNARTTLETILAAGGLPVINENDTVATDEIRYGDNDRLAARVAQMMTADLLVLLSDVDGLYTADPRKDAGARHIAELEGLDEAHMAMAGDPNAEAGVGSGGMVTKLMAAQIAESAGCATLIADGRREHPIAALQDGARATLIRARTTPARAREAWLQSHLKPEGHIRVDAGAARALSKGASLLPVGVVGVDGEFDRGAAVGICLNTGDLIGFGVSAYSARDIARIAGKQSDAVEALLGWRGRPAVIHRNDLVLRSA